MATRRIFAGRQLRDLRAGHGLRQAAMAARLGISAAYLSQLENDERPVTHAISERLAAGFPREWQDIGTSSGDLLLSALREAAADPLFASPMPQEQLARICEQHPALAERFVALHAAYRGAGERLSTLDEAIAGGGQLPWEEVRDWFHFANNYVDPLDRAAEALAERLAGDAPSPGSDALERHLGDAHGIAIHSRAGALREFDPATRSLFLDPGQPPESRRFQLAWQVAAVEFVADIAAVIEGSGLRSEAARKLLFIGLSNYAAGALLMPYARFRGHARELRHDIDRLRLVYGSSFEQTCHRLSTLQRPGERGLPVFFCRVDMAGNITKRHSATRLQFARFGGACPLWIVHEAVAIPDRILVQLAETPDGVRYISMAKGLVKPSDSYLRPPRRYAVALGCEAADAAAFVYADGIDTSSAKSATGIGVSCRICPRNDCDQRAFPPGDREIGIEPDRREIVPYIVQ
jgi:predicted transcriptional regulator/transcriptional regulator with XRE-family HTH domain